jgi:plasmid stability protein
MPVTPSSPDDPPVRVVAAMPASMAAELRAVAQRHDRPVAAEIRQAVRAHLARAEHEPGEEAPQ